MFEVLFFAGVLSSQCINGLQYPFVSKRFERNYYGVQQQRPNYKKLPTLLRAVNKGEEGTGQIFVRLMLAQFTLYLGVGAVIPSLPLFAGAIGLSSKLSGIVIAAPAGAMLIAARSAGAFADQGRKPAMLFGMALIAIADAWTAFSTALIGLLCARFALGFGRSISESGERGMLADLANQAPELRGRGLSIQQAISAIGLTIGAPVGGLAVEMYGIRAAFLCVTFAAIGTLLIYATLPETLPSKNIKDKKNSNDQKKIVSWRKLWNDPAWRALCAAEAGARATYAAKVSIVPVLSARLFDNSPTAAGLVLSAAAISGFVGAPIGGICTDSIGPRATAAFCGFLSGLSLILIPFTLLDSQYSRYAFVTAIAMWSAFVSAQGPALTSLGQMKAQIGAESTSLALPRAAGDAAFLITPFLLGAVTDAHIGPQGSECAVAGFLLVVGALSLLATPAKNYHSHCSSKFIPVVENRNC